MKGKARAEGGVMLCIHVKFAMCILTGMYLFTECEDGHYGAGCHEKYV